MADELPIGTHRLRTEGDTVLVRWIGIPEYDDVRVIHQHYDRVLTAYPRIFIVNDMRQSGLPSAQTRQFIATWVKGMPVGGVANFGASLPVRALQSLLLRASALMGAQPIPNVHFRNEAEAFAWVAARRQELG